MLEWLGLLYGIAKDVKGYLEFKEEDKLVDMSWLTKSGFDEQWQQKGYKLRWSRPDKIASRSYEGWEVIYEVDKIQRIRRRIVLKGGMVLIGKYNE
jgi:hypothetical protein